MRFWTAAVAALFVCSTPSAMADSDDDVMLPEMKSGPFTITVESITSTVRKSIEARGAQTSQKQELQISLSIEADDNGPDNFSTTMSAEGVVAQDNSGKNLASPNEFGGRHFFAGFPDVSGMRMNRAATVQIVLRGLSSSKSIKTLKGSIPVRIVGAKVESGRLKLPAKKGSTLANKKTELIVNSFEEKNGRLVVSGTRSRALREDGFPGADLNVALVDLTTKEVLQPRGHSITSTQFELDFASRGAKGSKYALVIYDTELKDEKIPFEFTNLPIPK